jgi:hypothetical protein
VTNLVGVLPGHGRIVDRLDVDRDGRRAAGQCVTTGVVIGRGDKRR